MGPVRIALAALLSLLLLHTTGAQGFAAMSIDFGSKFMKIGLVKPGVPMEIVLNKESRRKTPSLVHIRNGERAFGDPALALAARYPTTVYGNLVDLVAKSLDHPLVEQYLRDYPQLKLVAHENRSTVAIPFGENVYSIESVLAMILSHARAATEAFAEQTVKDAVISVPAFFNQAERQAIADAAKIAKLNLLQLINDGTAAALGYGVFRRKEITEKPQRLLIYDMGAAKTEATLVEYKIAKDKKGYKEPHVIVLGVGYDRTLGGEVFTLRMRELLVEKFRAHYKTENDVTTNPKGMMKMYKEAERVKQVLSANADHFAQIESVHEDKDMRVKVTRDELNALIAGYEKRMARPVKDALEMAGLGIDQVDQVVLMGAGTRVPRVQDVLQAAVGGKELGRFLNTDEAIAMGGLYQAAHLSKGFKVKPFYVDELQMLPIQVHFVSRQKNDATGEMTEKPVEKAIFGYKSKYPTGRKVMSFTSYTDDFSFSLHYGDLSHLSDEQKKLMGSSQISDVAISGLKKALEEKVNSEENEFKGVKAAFSMDYSGLVHIEGAEAIIEKKPKGVVESAKPVSAFASLTNTISGFFGGDSKKEEGEPTEEASPNGEQGSNDENVEKQDEASEADGSEAKPKETGKKNDEPAPEEAETSKSKKEEAKEADSSTEKKSKDSADKKDKNATKDEKKEDVPAVVKVKLAVAELRKDSQPTGVEERKAAIKILEQFEREERLREERHHAENELESYAFEASLLPEDDNFIAHSRDEERENLQKEATRVRAWLEDDTDPSTPTDDFRANLLKLKDIVVPVKKRIEEAQTRPAAVADLEKLINSTLGLITLTRQNITATETESMDKSLKAMNDEVDGFAAKVDKLVSWLVDKKEAQDKLTVKDDPVLKTEELKNKAAALQRAFTQHYSKMTRLADDAAKARKKAEREAKKKERDEKEKAAKAEGAAETTGGEESTSEKKPEEPAVKVDEPSKKDDAKETDSKTEL